jgi:3-hydroxybutyryl-CoA dehydrogenase
MSTEASLPDKRWVGVIGAGRMGGAIAQIFAAKGYGVVVVETQANIRETIFTRLDGICRKRGQPVIASNQIILAEELSPVLARCELVIEAAPEKLEIKQKIFSQLDALCGPETILATNTSVIPVTEVGAQAKRRGRILGTHFWNPPYAVRLVEVVQTKFTSPDVVARTIAFLDEVGQIPVHVMKDVPGFIGNRLQHALKREAIALVQDGVCDAETVDLVVKKSFGARLGIMGPLEQSDLVGLDLTLDIHSVVLSVLDRSVEPQRLLVEKVAAGKLGARVGEGFRKWTPEQRAELESRLDRALLSTGEQIAPTKG